MARPAVLAFSQDEACELGLHEAIILNGLRFWIDLNRKNGRNYKNGRYWTFNSVKAWAELYPFLTPKQVWTTIENLKKAGVIIVTAPGEGNQTCWYAISEDADEPPKQAKADSKKQGGVLSPSGKSPSPSGKSPSLIEEQYIPEESKSHSSSNETRSKKGSQNLFGETEEKPIAKVRPTRPDLAAIEIAGGAEADKCLAITDYLIASVQFSKNIKFSRGKRRATHEAIERMHRLDGVSWSRIFDAAVFAFEKQSGEFQFVVESGESLRKKFIRIEAMSGRASAGEQPAQTFKKTTVRDTH